MKARTLLVITAFSLVVAASGFALWSNSTYAVAVSTCGGHWGPNMTWIAQGWGSSFCRSVVYVRQLGTGVSEGLAVVGLLLVLMLAVPHTPAWLSRPLRLPESLKALVLSVFLALFALYFWTVGFHVSFAAASYVVPPSTESDVLPTISYAARPSFDPNAGWFLYAWLASLLFIYGLPKGAAHAFRNLVVWFAAPAVLILEAKVLVLNWSQMTMNVTNFTLWSLPFPRTMYLVSNWFVLVVVSFLAIWGYAPLLLRKAGVGRRRGWPPLRK